jgi:hypothetical protein
MGASRRWLASLCVVGGLFGPGSAAFAQGDATAAVTTDLTYAGGLSAEVTGSDTNACVLEDGELRAQLLGVGAASILSFDLSDAQVGTYPIQPGSEPLLQLITLSDNPNELLENWYGTAGTLTIGSLDATVPLDDGSATTKGATGSIDADMTEKTHGTVHISGAWACHSSL